MNDAYSPWWHPLARRAALLALCSAIACTNDDDDTTNDTAGDAGSDAPEGTVVAGTVTDSEGNPLAEVELRSGDSTATSDTEGRFELPVDAGEAVIVHLHKPGFVRGLERVTVFEGETVGGIVEVHLTPLNPAIAAEYDAYPGDGLARTTSGALVQLETFGVLDVTVRQDGQDLTIAEGMGVQIEIPLPDPAPAEMPATVALWGFDEDAGVWEEEGIATLDIAAGIYRGTITHLSPWNADKPLETTCVKGHVKDPEGRALAGTIVYAEGIDYLGGSSATSDENGEFCVPVRKDSRVEITAYDWGNGAAVREIVSGSDDTDVPPLCSDPRCQDEGVWTIVPGEGPMPWDPASCDPPEDEPVGLSVALGGAFAVDIDVTRADGLEVCGWVIDDPAATTEPSGATMLAFFEPSGWQVFMWVEGGGGDVSEDAVGWVSVQHQSNPELNGASLCNFDLIRSEEVADDLWGVAGMGECTGWYPGAVEGDLQGSVDFSAIAGELGGLFPTLCCDLSMMPTPPM